MPTRNEIIAALFVSKEFNDCINKMEPEHLRDDLRSEVVLILLETDEAKLQGMHDRNELRFYATRIILNLIQSNTSQFYRTYRQYSIELPPTIATSDSGPATTDYDEVMGMVERREAAIMNILDGMYWYDAELVKLYAEKGSYRAIEAATSIPWQSCHDTIKLACFRIKHELRKLGL